MLPLLKEFYEFLMTRKKYWLIPVILVLILMSVFLVMTQGSALAPFIYTLF